MHVNKSYKNRNCAQIALGTALKKMGMRIADVEYETKRIGNRYHTVLDQDGNGKHMLKTLEAQGFIVTH